MKTYHASMDTTTRIITVVVLTILLMVVLENFRSLAFDTFSWTTLLLHLTLFLFFAVVVLACWFYAPASYILDDNQLVIKRNGGELRFFCNEITEVRLLEKREARLLIRMFGVGGLFGYYGVYYSASIGRINMYATRLNHRILITMRNGRRMIITPDETGLEEALKKAAGVL